jgi:hypothetical protein
MYASRWRLAALGAAVALLVVLWGGYGRHWSWTGINGRTATLWDWLHLLLLPVVVGMLPIWLSRKTRLPPRYQSRALIALGAFAALVLIGYVVPWVWTGFAGNRLWDWLELLALPVALALTPLLDEIREGWSSRHTVVASAGLTAFVAVVVAGYAWNWGWTGFRGNTLWNWLQLLLLPLLVPMVVVPALKPRAMSTVAFVKHDQEPPAAPAADQQPPGAPAADQQPPAAPAADQQSPAAADRAVAGINTGAASDQPAPEPATDNGAGAADRSARGLG